MKEKKTKNVVNDILARRRRFTAAQSSLITEESEANIQEKEKKGKQR